MGALDASEGTVSESPGSRQVGPEGGIGGFEEYVVSPKALPRAG
jgi:hypothetical protein